MINLRATLVQEVIVGSFGILICINPSHIGMLYVFLCLDAALENRFLTITPYLSDAHNSTLLSFDNKNVTSKTKCSGSFSFCLYFISYLGLF